MRRALAVALAVTAAGCGSSPSHQPAAPARTVPAPPPRVRHAGLPPASAQDAALGHLAGERRPIYCAAGRKRLIALTFDDGPGPYTRLALKELKAARVRATFFLVARSILNFSEWPLLEARAGNALGDHTASHPVLPQLTRRAMVSEITDGARAVQRASGVHPRLFRPPYGAFNPSITHTAERLGMAEILWSVDSGDSISGNFHDISLRVRQATRPGSIVLFHENRGQTIRALRSLLPWFKRHHYRLVTVPELLAADPPSRAQLLRGEDACLAHPART